MAEVAVTEVVARKTRKPADPNAPSRVQGPKPAYITYKIDEAGVLVINSVSRKAEEVLATVDADKSLKYARFEIK